MRFEDRTELVRKFTERGASKTALAQFLSTCAAENPNRRLRMIALSDRVSTPVERADFDDLVTLVSQAPTWDKDRLQGIRVLLRAIADGHADAPDQILARWTWKLARASRKAQDRRASAEFPEAKRLLGALANSRGHRHEENAARLVNAAMDQPLQVGVALLASAEGYTPRANQLLDAAREKLGTITEIAGALADNLPQPKLQPSRKRRRKRKRKPAAAPPQDGQAPAEGVAEAPAQDGAEPQAPPKKRRRRRRKSASAAAANGATAEEKPAAGNEDVTTEHPPETV
jgi:ribonuclease E